MDCFKWDVPREQRRHSSGNKWLSDRRLMQVIVNDHLPSCYFYVMAQMDDRALFCTINQGFILFIHLFFMGKCSNESSVRPLFSELIHYVKQIIGMPLICIHFIHHT